MLCVVLFSFLFVALSSCSDKASRKVVDTPGSSGGSGVTCDDGKTFNPISRFCEEDQPTITPSSGEVVSSITKSVEGHGLYFRVPVLANIHSVSPGIEFPVIISFKSDGTNQDGDSLEGYTISLDETGLLLERDTGDELAELIDKLDEAVAHQAPDEDMVVEVTAEINGESFTVVFQGETLQALASGISSKYDGVFSAEGNLELLAEVLDPIMASVMIILAAKSEYEDGYLSITSPSSQELTDAVYQLELILSNAAVPSVNAPVSPEAEYTLEVQDGVVRLGDFSGGGLSAIITAAASSVATTMSLKSSAIKDIQLLLKVSDTSSSPPEKISTVALDGSDFRHLAQHLGDSLATSITAISDETSSQELFAHSFQPLFEAIKAHQGGESS